MKDQRTKQITLDEERNRFLKHRKFRTNTLPALVTVGPMALWLCLFIVIPMIYVVVISFMGQGSYGYIDYHITAGSYKEMLQPLYLKIFGLTLLVGIGATVVVLLVGYPIAYFMARRKNSQGVLLMLLMMIPGWTIGLVRMYSWIRILKNNGTINTMLLKIGIIEVPLKLLYTNGAVAFGLVLSLLTFGILPLYSSIEKLDETYLEAAKDLGAKPFEVLKTVILPLTSGGIFASVILTFIPALGVYIVADMYGGGTILYLGNLIRNQMLNTRNWPFGCALSVLLIIITLIILFAFTRFYDLEELDV